MQTYISIREAAVQVLADARGPLHVSEITEHVRTKVEIYSRTPEKTVNNALQKDSRVERVGRGMFQLIR
jgi:hypothetical protein